MTTPTTALFWCPHPKCDRHFTMQRGLTRHLRETHGAQHPLLEEHDVSDHVPGVPPARAWEHPLVQQLVAMLPAVDDYDYELVDDIGHALQRALHAVYRAA